MDSGGKWYLIFGGKWTVEENGISFLEENGPAPIFSICIGIHLAVL
jgi:hypothetical protein